MTIFQVDIPIFQTSVICCHSCSAEEAMDAFYNFKDSKSHIELDTEEYKQGRVVLYKGDIFMWVKDPVRSSSYVFHELIHVYHGMRELKGMEFDEETEAYFMGWMKLNIADEIFFPTKHKKKKGKKHGKSK